VAKAYRELEWQGVIVSERGSGSFIQAQPAQTAKPDAKEKEAKLQTLYQRLLTEAAGSGLSESELLSFIKQRKNPAS
jgi:DNA-binding transcriptional regulator YhcF (GntR family)